MFILARKIKQKTKQNKTHKTQKKNTDFQKEFPTNHSSPLLLSQLRSRATQSNVKNTQSITVKINNTIDTFSMNDLKFVSYFNALLTPRWTKNEMNNLSSKNNCNNLFEIQNIKHWNVNHLRCLIECIKNDENIPCNVPSDISFILSLIECDNFLMNRQVITCDKLIDFLYRCDIGFDYSFEYNQFLKFIDIKPSIERWNDLWFDKWYTSTNNKFELFKRQLEKKWNKLKRKILKQIERIQGGQLKMTYSMEILGEAIRIFEERKDEIGKNRLLYSGHALFVVEEYNEKQQQIHQQRGQATGKFCQKIRSMLND